MLKLSDFDFNLPKELIAQYPLEERDSARLLVLERSSGRIEHCLFKDVGQYLSKEDLLILNNTKVLPSRIFAKRLTGGKVEILLLKRKYGPVFNALIKPARLRIGEKIIFNGGKTSARITAKNELEFNTEDIESIYKLGVMPLPPYIKREAEESDSEYYQTVYAKEEGAVASPTAGLHFTRELMAALENAGIVTAYITLHVGLGTFKPVKSEDITMHKMEEEDFSVGAQTIALVRKAKEGGKKVIAVGTTSLRALESASGFFTDYRLPITDYLGSTSLFIYPGYQFKITNFLLTNFHLPKTTLFMLACAFAGEALVKKAYAQAIEKKYRFYSYGDAMLII